MHRILSWWDDACPTERSAVVGFAMFLVIAVYSIAVVLT